MPYYEVLVASQKYHKADPLTYVSDETLPIGCVVIVPLQRESVPAVVVKSSARKPQFATKPILRSLPIELPRQLIQLHAWLAEYYPAPGGLITQLFLPSSLTQQSRSADALPATVAAIAPPPLTPQQVAAIAQITAATSGTIMLHGDTGTGKTRVYTELVQAALTKGQSAIVLTPEIGLTPQLEQNLAEVFPGKVVTLHSTMTIAERRKAWLRIAQATSPLVVIGPRSALFAPLASVGVIIMDEAHDTAYKQEQAPYYQTSRAAARLAALHHAKLIMGSATPTIADYYACEQKRLPIVRLTDPAITSNHASQTHVINLRDSSAFSQSPWLSNTLLTAISNAMASSQQSLVFLNRRGTARLVSCQECGWQAACPRCDLPLTYHGDTHSTRCHTCGYRQPPPSSCPECASGNILFKSIGTKTLVAELERLFPKARIARFDSDSIKSETLSENYEAIRAGSVDILVGTQMLSKGLDLPKLQVVGVVVADTGLYFPDFTAEERTYQMLSQVMGRVGRGHGASTIIVQSYNPDGPAIQAALKKDYAGFYTEQIHERELFRFPPFCFVLKLTCIRASSKAAETTATKLADILAETPGCEVSGPAPAFTEKIKDQYRWQVIIKSKQRSALVGIIKNLPAKWQYDIDPSNLL